MKIAIHGPNDSWTGPTFHVHAADCRDRKRPMYRFGGGPETKGYVYDAGDDDALTIAAE